MGKSKVVLVGTGGVGAIAALSLEKGDHAEVTAVVRSNYEVVSKNGFHFESVDYGTVPNWFPTRIVRSIEEAAAHKPYDYVLVSVKNIPELQSTEDLVRPLVGPGTAIVLLQNGVGNELPVMEAFPDAYVIGGVSMIGSANHGGKVRHTGPDKVQFGTLDKRPEAQKALEHLVHIYSAAGKSEATISPNIAYRRWVKLVYNATYNTCAALTGLDTGRMLFAGLDKTLILPAMYEVRAVAEAELGEKLPDGIEEFMLNSDEGIYYEPSMLIDVKNGRPMELEMILGSTLRSAERTGTPAPILSTVYKVLRGVQFKLLEGRGHFTVPAEPFDRDNAKPVNW